MKTLCCFVVGNQTFHKAAINLTVLRRLRTALYMQRQQLPLKPGQTTSARIRAPLDATKFLQFVISVGERQPAAATALQRRRCDRRGAELGRTEDRERGKVVCSGLAVD